LKTIRNGVLGLLLAVGVLASADCSSSSSSVCTAGAAEACVGAGGCKGEQTCDSAGTSYGSCVCPSGAPDAGGEKDGSSKADTGSGTGETTAGIVAKCSGTYTCVGAETATITLLKQASNCTVMLNAMTGDLEANGTIMDGSFSVGTWSVAPSGVVTVILLGNTSTCTPS